MKLVTFSDDARSSVVDWGAVVGDRVVKARACAELLPRFTSGAVDQYSLGNPPPDSIVQLLALPDGLARLSKLLERVEADTAFFQNEGAVLPLSSVRLLPPIPAPGKFLCVGKNYRDHLDELIRNGLLNELPEEPTAFVKLNETLVGSEAKVVRPSGISTMDYEPEMVFVIGRGGVGIRPEDAMSHVIGVTLLNDLTAREIQKREVVSGTRFWTAKNMPGFGPVGPWITTLDEIGDPHDLWMTLSVNGEERIRVHTGDQIFKIPDIVAHFSRYLPLHPGDMFSTGSPGGVAVGQTNASELYLRPGDVVEAGFDGLGSLRTFIVDDQSMPGAGREAGI